MRLRLARDIRDKNNIFYHCVTIIKLKEENIDSLQNGVLNLVTVDTVRLRYPMPSLTQVLIKKVSQASMIN